MCCTKCGSKNISKAGFVKKEQRYKCKEGGYQLMKVGLLVIYRLFQQDIKEEVKKKN